MTKPLVATTWQTVGPYFSLGLSPLYRDELATEEAFGERIFIAGCILDGDSKPVPDAVLEVWQADGEGKYSIADPMGEDARVPVFVGFGRVATSQNGEFRFSTIKPGPVSGPNGALQAPHILVSVLMRGLLTRLVTRIYFSDDPHNEDDFVLKLVDPLRRKTLMAMPAPGAPTTFEWNIILQGANETVFFDCWE